MIALNPASLFRAFVQADHMNTGFVAVIETVCLAVAHRQTVVRVADRWPTPPLR
jgi:hypothetical protein